jgi:NDP-sugar pyrophosphorylase family protein
VPDRPKVLAEVCGRPFIFFLLNQLAKVGIQRAVLCTGYKGWCVEKVVGRRYRTLNLEYSKEARPLGTGGALRNANQMVSSELILVMNGDSFVDVDYQEFVTWHQRKNARLSIVMAAVEAPGCYGTVGTDLDGKVTNFSEKKDAKNSGSTYINAGIYLMHRSIIDALPAGNKLSLEREVLPQLVGQQVFGYKTTGIFIDIGTPESYRSAGTVLEAF